MRTARTLVRLLAMGALASAGTVRADVAYLPTINVTGAGVVATESTYLPNVIACEMGAAPLEALKAQAVVARTYAYYRMLTCGAVVDGTADQVYTCRTPATEAHRAAAADTACEVLTYSSTAAGEVISAFFVAGAPATHQNGALVAGFDPNDTERYVTYNAGRRGGEVAQTPLGYTVPDPLEFRDNRGCLSQNGARVLAENGYRYDEILRFYYGADIGITVANGCAEAQPRAHGDDADENRIERTDVTDAGDGAARLSQPALTPDEAICAAALDATALANLRFDLRDLQNLSCWRHERD